MKNFRLPFPVPYKELRDAARRSGLPVTAVARDVIALWLRTRRNVARYNAIATYAARTAGTDFDLDPRLEAAAIEHLIQPRAGSRFK